MRTMEEKVGKEGKKKKRDRWAWSPPSVRTLLSLFARLTLQERSNTPCIMGESTKKGGPKKREKIINKSGVISSWVFFFCWVGFFCLFGFFVFGWVFFSRISELCFSFFAKPPDKVPMHL